MVEHVLMVLTASAALVGLVLLVKLVPVILMNVFKCHVKMEGFASRKMLGATNAFAEMVGLESIVKIQLTIVLANRASLEGRVSMVTLDTLACAPQATLDRIVNWILIRV